jgi:nucleoside-diphosphate-sugar epimerase
MHIFLAGGSGVIGTKLIPALIAAGHEVTATTRSVEKLQKLADLGATGVVVDAYDPARVKQVIGESGAELVIHELTDLSESNTDANAKLRREGTKNLVDAIHSAGIGRIIMQSITWIFPDGPTPAAETDPITPGTAVEEMERLANTVPRATVLRYGMLYGPNTWYAPGGRVAAAVTAGLVPATPAITTFAHIDDVIAATVQSIEWPDGTYHVVDDEPATGAEWLPVYADIIGAPTPKSVPLPDGAPTGRAVSNAKARSIGWAPLHPSWRDGFFAL